ncbi:IMPACT family protein [Oceanivirga miroungae]|uniref:IMPACT family member YigZ n=1 Tax=Oceanivirga miroungae TaxID=1130046 RepID=A0A6I8MDY8_9FUSO|nr:YigZ family protein [Oceanivirga miroungae]VWL85767.1 IMPACT family member YigZ [Oceanivirga miroungae]
MVVVKNDSQIEFVERKSKFIGYLKVVKTKKEAIDFIEYINKIHKDATHNVYVYRLIENGVEHFKYDDDGEPLNTAAKPMAEIFERKNIYNFVMIATRYFGGIKLGAGGLIRAYAKVATKLYESIELIEYVEKEEYLISFSYDKLDLVEKLIRDNELDVLEKSFLEKINMKLELSKEELLEFEKLRDIMIIKI